VIPALACLLSLALAVSEECRVTPGGGSVDVLIFDGGSAAVMKLSDASETCARPQSGVITEFEARQEVFVVPQTEDMSAADFAVDKLCQIRAMMEVSESGQYMFWDPPSRFIVIGGATCGHYNDTSDELAWYCPELGICHHIAPGSAPGDYTTRQCTNSAEFFVMYFDSYAAAQANIHMMERTMTMKSALAALAALPVQPGNDNISKAAAVLVALAGTAVAVILWIMCWNRWPDR